MYHTMEWFGFADYIKIDLLYSATWNSGTLT